MTSGSLPLQLLQNLLESGLIANRVELMVVLELARAREPLPD